MHPRRVSVAPLSSGLGLDPLLPPFLQSTNAIIKLPPTHTLHTTHTQTEEEEEEGILGLAAGATNAPIRYTVKEDGEKNLLLQPSVPPLAAALLLLLLLALLLLLFRLILLQASVPLRSSSSFQVQSEWAPLGACSVQASEEEEEK